MATTNLKLTHADAREDKLVLGLRDEADNDYEVTINSMNVADLLGSIRAALADMIGHPKADSYALPGMKRVQYLATPNEVFFRVFLSDRVSHDYPVPRGTTLATELEIFGNRVEALNLAKATHQPPEPDISGKKN